VSQDRLDQAIASAIGDPTTCVLIAEKDSGKLLYRYNAPSACARSYPACDRPQATKLADVLEATRKDGQPRMLSCYTTPDHSRGVGWASGDVPGKPYVYAAVMGGERSFPGRMMADRLETAFRRAGLNSGSGS
jgi:hypothetical protein